MSQANVEAVEHGLDVYNRRDIDGLISLADPDIEFRSLFVAVEPVFRGYEGIRYLRELDDAYEYFQVVPIEFIDAGAAVLWVGRFEWRGKGSGDGGALELVPAQWLTGWQGFSDRVV